MAVTTSKTDTAKKTAPAKTAASPEVISIVLARYERLHLAGNLFEGGKVYTLKQEQAEYLLSVEHDDEPVFKRYKGKVIAQAVVEEPVVTSQVVDLNHVELDDAPQAAAPRIEIGDAEDLAELGLSDEAGDNDGVSL